MRRLVLFAVLGAWTVNASAQLVIEGELAPGPSYSAYLVSYESDGLTVHAMVAVPDVDTPGNGFPVVIANHGYVPDPRRYGFTADGVDSRPGDYYRSVPELFASRGFLVVLPDYRGHNSSEGFEQIKDQNRESVAMYAHDVVALMSVLDDIEKADPDKVFMWSHSMGGNVSMLALLATEQVRASSFWATGAVDEHFMDLERLHGPVMIQHSVGDASTEFANSERLAAALERAGHPVVLHSYEGQDHFFDVKTRERAADRDADFFLLQLNH
jgi:dienelactone hydrolase